MNDKTVLCVDDEPGVLNSIKRILRSEDFNLFTAAGGKEGLDILHEHNAQVVISDQRMPEMSGTEFLEKVKGHYPDTMRVIFSGYTDSDVFVPALNNGEVYRFLPKPWNDDELRGTIRTCLDHYEFVQKRQAVVEQIQTGKEAIHWLDGIIEESILKGNRSIYLCRQILDKLRLPLMWINHAETIVFANQALVTTFPLLPKFKPDTRVQYLLPPHIIGAIHDCLGGFMQMTLPLLWYGQNVRLRTVPLRINGVIIGCILILEPRPFSISTS
jgi:two-component system NtrC family sensor kinase